MQQLKWIAVEANFTSATLTSERDVSKGETPTVSEHPKTFQRERKTYIYQIWVTQQKKNCIKGDITKLLEEIALYLRRLSYAYRTRRFLLLFHDGRDVEKTRKLVVLQHARWSAGSKGGGCSRRSCPINHK